MRFTSRIAVTLVAAATTASAMAVPLPWLHEDASAYLKSQAAHSLVSHIILFQDNKFTQANIWFTNSRQISEAKSTSALTIPTTKSTLVGAASAPLPRDLAWTVPRKAKRTISTRMRITCPSWERHIGSTGMTSIFRAQNRMVRKTSMRLRLRRGWMRSIGSSQRGRMWKRDVYGEKNVRRSAVGLGRESFWRVWPEGWRASGSAGTMRTDLRVRRGRLPWCWPFAIFWEPFCGTLGGTLV